MPALSAPDPASHTATPLGRRACMIRLMWRRGYRPLLSLTAALSGSAWRPGTSATDPSPCRRCRCGSAAPDAASAASVRRTDRPPASVCKPAAADAAGDASPDAAGAPGSAGASGGACWEERRGVHLGQPAAPHPQGGAAGEGRAGGQGAAQGLRELDGSEGGSGAPGGDALSAAPLSGLAQPEGWQWGGGACAEERGAAGGQEGGQQGQRQDSGWTSEETLDPAGSPAAGRAELLAAGAYQAARAWRETGFGSEGGQPPGSGLGDEGGRSTGSGSPPALDGADAQQEYLRGFGSVAAAEGGDGEGLWDPDKGFGKADAPDRAAERQEYLRGFGSEAGDGGDGEGVWDPEEGIDEDAEGLSEEESEDEAPAGAAAAGAGVDAKAVAAAEVCAYLISDQ